MSLLDDRNPAPTPDTGTPASARTSPLGASPAGPLAPRLALAVGIGLVTAVVAVLLPDATRHLGNGSMTHYMGLLAADQPWNLLLFMAVPVILAETLAITELVLLLAAAPARGVRLLNRWAGLLAGVWFFGIAVHLGLNAVWPLTVNSGWHGPADLVAVGAYLAGVIPLAGIALLELGVLGRAGGHSRLRLHVTFVAIFLVVAHVAMIFGMLDPTLLGWSPSMPGGSMPGMDM